MRRKEIAKKLGIMMMAFMLALPCAVPVICPADEKEPETAAQAPAADEMAVPDLETEESSEGLKLSMKTFKKEYKTDDGLLYKEISFEYPVAEGSSEAAQTLNKFYKNLLSKWKKAATEDLKEAEEIVSEAKDNGGHYADQVSCEITCNDKDYISVLQLGYDYTMGAHGMPYRYTYVFDAKTGKKVSAASMLGLSKSKLNQKVRSLYMKKYDKTQKAEDYMFYPNKDEVKTTLEKINFNQNLYYLKNGKVRFYVDPYAVGPYAAGFIEVAVKLK